jgi:hypothetical protein
MSFKRNVYLKMKTLQEARDILFQTFGDLPPLPAEKISVPDAVGRVLAESVNARLSSPNFHLAAMDGLALKAEITFGANAAAPKELVVGRDAFYVNTGHVLPESRSKHRHFHGKMSAGSEKTLSPPSCFSRKTMSSRPIALEPCWQGVFSALRSNQSRRC